MKFDQIRKEFIEDISRADFYYFKNFCVLISFKSNESTAMSDIMLHETYPKQKCLVTALLCVLSDCGYAN